MIPRLLSARVCAPLLALVLACGALPAVAMAGPAGLYRTDRMEVAGELLLREDGTYAYALSVGALDEASQGRWSAQGDTLTLTTDPVPRPARFTTGPALALPAGDKEPLPYLAVTLPGGRGLAGIDFTITCRDGQRVDGWSPDSPGPPCDTPQWIELFEPIHAVRSERFPIPAGAGALHFVLVPNDIGIIDLTGATAVIAGDRLTLSRNPGVIGFRRVTR